MKNQKASNLAARIMLGAGMFSLLFAPPYLTHAQSISFTTDAQGNSEYSAGFQSTYIYLAFITSDGRGSGGNVPNPWDTGVPSSVKMEVFAADTQGGTFANPCSSPRFTGDPSSDLACLAIAAQSQGYAYTIGQSWSDAPTSSQTVATSPCNCP
jgi:hypothetical protein